MPAGEEARALGGWVRERQRDAKTEMPRASAASRRLQTELRQAEEGHLTSNVVPMLLLDSTPVT